MENYPRTIMEFEKQFNSEEACLQYLFDLRWPNGFQCPRCGFNKAWQTKRGLYLCCNCDNQVSIISGTIFQDTHKPLRLWFRAIWYITSQKYGVSALGLQRVLGLGSYRTAWIWLHKLRVAMVRPGRERLSGTIEADETFIGGEKAGKRGRGAEGKTLVLIMAELNDEKIGRIRLSRIPNASSDSLMNTINKHVEPGTIVHTDGWKGYEKLNDEGFQRIIIRDETEVGNSLLPHAHRVASLLKRWLLGTHQGAVRSSHLDYYLDEFTFRFNRRTSSSRGKLFYRLIQQAALVEPVKGSDFIGGTLKHNI